MADGIDRLLAMSDDELAAVRVWHPVKGWVSAADDDPAPLRAIRDEGPSTDDLEQWRATALVLFKNAHRSDADAFLTDAQRKLLEGADDGC